MNVDTDSFRALSADVADLRQQMAELRRRQMAELDVVVDATFAAGRASVSRGWSRAPRSPGPDTCRSWKEASRELRRP